MSDSRRDDRYRDRDSDYPPRRDDYHRNRDDNYSRDAPRRDDYPRDDRHYEDRRREDRRYDDRREAPKSSSGGWGDEPSAPVKSSGGSGGGWGDDAPAPKSSGGDGGWGDSSAPAPKSSGGGGGWGDAPAKSSGGDGGWGASDSSAPKSSGGDGGWGASDSSAPKSSGGDDGWGASEGGDGGDKGATGGDGCRKCGEEGHWAKDCPKAGGSGCRKCGEEGHWAKDCPNGGGGGGGGGGSGCRRCGEEGHFAAECPNPDTRGPREDKPEDECWRCGAMGHTAHTCTTRIACGNDPTKIQPSRHNMLFNNDLEEGTEFDADGLAAGTDDRTEELFGTHSNTGIQFSKYESIRVEVFGSNIPKAVKNFSDLKLHPVIMNNLKLANWDVPTPIQKYALPIGLAGRDIMGCAQTGSGKTAAFLFPMINSLLKINVKDRRSEGVTFPRALIVVPVRELAQQIHIESIKFTYRSTLRSVCLYGGSGSRDQKEALSKGCDILVGTPGRLIDFLKNEVYNLSKLQFLCFDEADRMLDMGFEDDMKLIIDKCPPTTERQTLMFSATFPEDIQALAKAYMKDDQVVITVGRVGAATPTVNQVVLYIEDPNKFRSLISALEENPVKTLIFVARKQTAEDLKQQLLDVTVEVETIHGDKDQYRREQALDDFKKSVVKVLIATDVAARGLDIPKVGHVINYDMPTNIDDYVHRIGRTGRVGHEGLATTFFNEGTGSRLAADLVTVLEEQSQHVEPWLYESAKNNPAGERKRFMPKNRGFSDAAGGSSAPATNDWGESGASAGGWDEAPAQSSGGGGAAGGWDEAPAQSSGGGGGWDEAPAKSSGGGGGWDEAPAKSSGGGWDEAPAKSSGGDGGWGEDAPSAPASSGGGGDGW